MACGKCNYEPVVAAWPHTYRSNYPTGKLPWWGDAGTVDSVDVADFVPTDGYLAMTLRLQVYGILPGDTVNWIYSEDGVTWYDIDAGPTTWGLDNGKSWIDYGESSEAAVRAPLAAGSAWWGVEVTRADCDLFTAKHQFSWATDGTELGTVQAEGWKTSQVEPVAFDIRTNSVSGNSTSAAAAAYVSRPPYELCPGEETDVPDREDLVADTLTIDCAEEGDVVELPNLGDYSAGADFIGSHLDTMASGAVLGTLYHDQFGSRTFYVVGAEQGIENIVLWFFDVYGRIFSLTQPVVLECDTSIGDLCGPCSILPNWAPALAPYFYQATLYDTLPLPWADTGATIDGTAAADYVPASGAASATLLLQALNILPGDVLTWEYSEDGVTYHDFGTGPVTQGIAVDAMSANFAQSTEAAKRLPLVDGAEYYFGLTIVREGCDEVNIRRYLRVVMTEPTGTSMAQEIELESTLETFSVVNARFGTLTNTAPEDVTGLETYLSCDDGCDPTGGGGGTTNPGGDGQEDIDELLEEVGECMEELAAKLWVDVAQLPCGT